MDDDDPRLILAHRLATAGPGKKGSGAQKDIEGRVSGVPGGSAIIRGSVRSAFNRGGFSPTAVDNALLNARQVIRRMLDDEKGVPRKQHKIKGKKYSDSFHDLCEWLEREYNLHGRQSSSLVKHLMRMGYVRLAQESKYQQGMQIGARGTDLLVFLEEQLLHRRLAEEERAMEEHVSENSGKLAVAIATFVVESASFRERRRGRLQVEMLLDGTVMSCSADEDGAKLPLVVCSEMASGDEDLLAALNSTRPEWVGGLLGSDGDDGVVDDEPPRDMTKRGLLAVECEVDLNALQAGDTQNGFKIGEPDLSKLELGGGGDFNGAVRTALSILHKSIVNMQLKLYVVEQALAFCMPIKYETCIQSLNAVDLPRRKVAGRGNPIADSTLVAPNLNHFTSFVCNESGWQDLSEKAEFEVNPSVTEVLAGRSLSTYPVDPNNAYICDTYMARLYEHQAHIVLADGCSWGLAPANAARFAALGFISFLEEMTSLHAEPLETTQDYASILYQAAYEAHRTIADRHQRFLKNHGMDSESPPGTTTLLGGVIVENMRSGDVHDSDTPFLGLFVSIGDCKAYRISAEDGSFLDLTKGTRPDGLVASDPGGRLGPYVDENPDIRNLRLLFIPLREGDRIVIVSDGVYDNFDPCMQGRDVAACGLEGRTTWDTVANMELDEMKERFAADLLRDARASKPDEIIDVFLEHCVKLTEPSRNFMRENPTRKLPDDYSVYPGKMDHTTAIVYTVGSPLSLEGVSVVDEDAAERSVPMSAPLAVPNARRHADDSSPDSVSPESTAASPIRSPGRPPMAGSSITLTAPGPAVVADARPRSSSTGEATSDLKTATPVTEVRSAEQIVIPESICDIVPADDESTAAAKRRGRGKSNKSRISPANFTGKFASPGGRSSKKSGSSSNERDSGESSGGEGGEQLTSKDRRKREKRKKEIESRLITIEATIQTLQAERRSLRSELDNIKDSLVFKN